MKVVVGSENPVKIKAVEEAFAKIWPNKKFNVVGVNVKSGVSSQPMSDIEAIKGATNRAKRALKSSGGDFGVGLEGGINKVGRRWFDCGWIVIVDRKGNLGIGTSARMETPKKMLAMINKGMELGDVNDILFKKKNSKQGEGHFGLMTNGVVTRKDGYREAVIMALARFIHPEIFEK